ncbi:hypothetical protein K1T71_001506 [Dendrolimus kikuchii]|uniref:Uncharacterized protein n=1 Tax=Dendrolimus kikuchii TaxID=765133 RepID=A0ACC1DI52_9NEOP|nr:hypothetical protein K1T71_001506 [Dendrolimus kikuchii]
MFERNFLFCVVACSVIAVIIGQSGVKRTKVPLTGFTCQGRTSGYYADMETGCQVYHMCDSLGRKFSYSCPNTTLFQQRMLICDHWYMVNCSMSERDYTANLLIGQRDKPFVSDEEMRLRTPRPDILSVPPSSNYYDGLREAESKFPIHPDNNIVGIADSISNDNNGLDSAKKNYRPPSSWSTRSKSKFRPVDPVDNLDGAASHEPSPTIRPLRDSEKFKPDLINLKNGKKITKPNLELEPPVQPSTESPTAEELTTASEDAVFKFIKRFDPNSPDSLKTAISKSEIINLNKHLPEGQVSSEEDRTPKKQKHSGNTLNKVGKDNDKSFSEGTRFDSVNIKPITQQSVPEQTSSSDITAPERILLPPKTDDEITKSQLPSTTMGPPIYYEWKWAVPAFGLELPKQGNDSYNISTVTTRSIGKSPFSDVTRSTIADEDATPMPRNVEYNISSYFIPDYVFPLDSPHPGYENDDAQTSFQVGVSRPGRASYGENPKCPQCHPAYLEPGTCEPCIVKR